MKNNRYIKSLFFAVCTLLFTPALFSQVGVESEDGIKVGNSTTTDAGVIRFNGSDFQGYDGSSWESFTAGGGGASPWMTSGTDVYYDGGDVGIGLTNPSHSLDIFDASTIPVRIASSSGSNQLFFFRNGSYTTDERSFIGQQNAQFRFGNNVPGSNFDWFITDSGGSGGVAMTLNASNGSLGINTTNPQSKLHIDAPTGDGILVEGDNPDVEIEISGNGTGEFKLTQPGVSFGSAVFALAAGTDVARIATSSTSNSGITMEVGTSSPNFGIGTLPSSNHKLEINLNSSSAANPSAQLNIRENNNGDFARLQFSQTGIDEYWHIAGISAPTVSGDSDLNFYFWDDANATGTNIMSIDGDQQSVGILTSNPQREIHINHDRFSDHGLRLENDFNNETWDLYVSQSTSNLALYQGGAFRGDFDDVTGAYSSVSDARLKSNIQNLSSMLPSIMQLRPTQYQFNHDESNTEYFGLIAQELKEVFPSMVNVFGDDSNGQSEIKDLHTVKYTDLIPVLIKGMQEQQEMIEAQQTQIEALIKQNEEILSRLND